MGTGESEGSNTDKAGPPGLSRWGKQGGEKEGLSSLAGCATIDGRKEADSCRRQNIGTLGWRRSTQPGLARGVLVGGPNSLNPHGMIHGGALATLADTVGGCCACSKGGQCVTASSTMEFLRPAWGGRIYCEATPKKLGRKLSVIQVTLTDEQEKVVATGTFTFFMNPNE